MKKQISTLLLALAAMTTLCYAQDSNLDLSSKFTTGLKFGLNYSNVYDSKGENFQADAKVGYVGGLFFSIPIGKTIGIQPEVLFSQRCFKGSGMLLGSAYKLTRTTNYLDIPLLLALKPSKTITLLAGPQFSFLLKQKDKFENGNVNVLQVQEFEADNIRKNTLCFLGGVDFNINHLTVGTRVGWDILNNNGDGTSQTPQYKNTWLQGTLGYRF